jgi:hypothetical protein
MFKLHQTRAVAAASLLALAGCDAPGVEPAGPDDLLAPAFSQSPAVHQTVIVNWQAQQQLIAFGGNGKSGPVDGSWAKLVRNGNGISYQIHAGELHPGNTYSLWLVVINNPGACAASPCTAGDILTNPATESQVLSGGTGTVAGAAGKGTLAGAASVGPLSGWLAGRSLDDPFTAEIHLVINDHGPKIPAFMPAMIKTYRAGCSDASPFPGVFPATALADGAPGPNTCLLYQAAVFPVP